MPASIIIDGQKVYEPGAFSKLNASSLEGRGPAARGRIGVLLELDYGSEPGVASVFSSASVLRRLLPPRDAAFLAPLLFAPSRDPRIPNGASAAVLVRVNPATRAQVALQGSGGACVVAKALDAGLYGNDLRVTVAVAAGVTTLTAKKGTVTQQATGISGLDALKVKYVATGGQAVDAVQVDVEPWADTYAKPAVAVSYAFTRAGNATPIDPRAWLAFDGALTFTVAGANAADRTFTVVGTDKATGNTVTDEVVIADGDLTGTTAHEFSEVTSILIPAAVVGNVTVSGNAFTLLNTSYPTIKTVGDRIAATGRGFTVTYLTARTGIKVEELDVAADVDAIAAGAGATLSADLYDWLAKAAAKISIVTFERDTEPEGVPVAMAETALAGGSNGVTSNSDWQAGYDALRAIGVSTIVPLTTSASIHAMLPVHTAFMCGRGRDERNGFVGIAKDSAKADLKAAVIALNDRNVSLWAQPITMYDEAGVATELEPCYTALAMAAMNAGRDPRYSIVNTVPGILGHRDSAHATDPWNTLDDMEELLEAGVGLLHTKIETGLPYVVRDSTTYLTDDNPIYGSITANEDANLSTKNVRLAVESFIGAKGFAGTKADVKARVLRELQRQKEANEIKDYDARSVDVVDLGNAYSVAYKFAVAEPILWVTNEAFVVRMPAAA